MIGYAYGGEYITAPTANFTSFLFRPYDPEEETSGAGLAPLPFFYWAWHGETKTLDEIGKEGGLRWDHQKLTSCSNEK